MLENAAKKESAGYSTKTMHLSVQTKEYLQGLKKHMGLRSESDVVDCLVNLYTHVPSFPREFLDYLNEKRYREDYVPLRSTRKRS